MPRQTMQHTDHVNHITVNLTTHHTALHHITPDSLHRRITSHHNKTCKIIYLISYHMSYIISYHIISYHMSYHISYHIIHTSYAMLSSEIPWNMPRVTCIFRIHTSLQASVYTKKIQVTSGMLHGIPRESIA